MEIDWSKQHCGVVYTMCPLVKQRIECPTCYPYSEACYGTECASKWLKFKAFWYHFYE